MPQNCCHIRPPPGMCGRLKNGRGKGGGTVAIPNLPPIFLPCLIHLNAYCMYHAGYPLILACNAEMPTSGDLKSGVSLFFTTPFPHPNVNSPPPTQPHPATTVLDII